MAESKGITYEQLSLIIQAIKSEISSEDFYSKLITLVEKVTVVDTQMVANQDELKRLIQDEVIPAFENIETIDAAYYRKTCEDVNKLLHGGEHKFLDFVKEIREAEIIKFIKRGIVALGTIGTIIALLGGFYFLWTTFVVPALSRGGQ